jgi:hypothetical protein
MRDVFETICVLLLVNWMALLAIMLIAAYHLLLE